MFQDEEDTPKKKARLGVGRPENPNSSAAFLHVIDFLESMDYENVTLRDLQRIMKEKLEELDVDEPSLLVYETKHLKQKLKDYFRDEVLFAEAPGVPTVVTLKRTAATILRDFHSKPQNGSIEEEKMRTIQAAAAFLRADIKSLPSQTDEYPDISSIETADQHDFVPPTLVSFMECLVKGKDVKLKTNAICQCIVQSTRPKTILAPLQVGLGVEMHKTFRSRFLIDTLNSLGFCTSYYEVQKFERSAAMAQGVQLPEVDCETTVQFVADNVDHNTRTLDGYNTFHGMGIIGIVTPGCGRHKERKIPRPKKMVSLKEITAIGHIEIHFYT